MYQMQCVGLNEAKQVVFRCALTGVEIGFDPDGDPAPDVTADGLAPPEGYEKYLPPFEDVAHAAAERAAQVEFERLMKG